MKTPPIIGVAEIVLSVTDVSAMSLFYQEVLGFEFHSEYVSEEEGDPHATGLATIVFLKICDSDSPLGRHLHPTMLALIDFQRHVHAKPRFDGHDVRRSTLNHLAFEIPTESFDDHLARLNGRGLETSLSEFPHMQAKAIFFKDPEGNTLELICQV